MKDDNTNEWALEREPTYYEIAKEFGRLELEYEQLEREYRQKEEEYLLVKQERDNLRGQAREAIEHTRRQQEKITTIERDLKNWQDFCEAAHDKIEKYKNKVRELKKEQDQKPKARKPTTTQSKKTTKKKARSSPPKKPRARKKLTPEHLEKLRQGRIKARIQKEKPAPNPEPEQDPFDEYWRESEKLNQPPGER